MPQDPDILVDLTTAASDFEAQVIVEALQAQGIPARAFTTAGSVLPLDLGSTQPFRIAVRRRDVETARAALRALRAESVDIDWNEVDVGDPVAAGVSDTGACIQCGYDVRGLSGPVKCPECGASLKDAAGAMTTPRRSTWTSVYVGLVLVALAAVAIFLFRRD